MVIAYIDVITYVSHRVEIPASHNNILSYITRRVCMGRQQQQEELDWKKRL